MIRATVSGLGAAVEGAVKGSSATRILQNALKAAGYNPGNIDGTFGDNTRRALQSFQTSQGLTVGDFPDNLTLDALGIPAGNWAQIIQDAGGPAYLVKAAQTIATRIATAELPGEEEPLPAPIVEERTEIVPAAAMSLSAKTWLRKNWPYFAVGGGVGLVVIIGAVLWTRRKPEPVGPGHVTHMAGLQRGRYGLRGYGRGAR
jgi:peptidoglycan hydrolase-like protein with peptidoglycan-binding domain